MSEFSRNFAIPSWPFSAYNTCMLCSSKMLVSAKMLRMSSSIINALLPDRAESVCRTCSSICRLFEGRFVGGRCRNNEVSSSSRSGDFTSLIMTASVNLVNACCSCLVNSLPVYTMIGKSCRPRS